jgi:hypothetical protein
MGGAASESCSEPGGFLGVDLGDRSSEAARPAVLAPRVGLEPTTLRLTDAGRRLVRSCDVGMRRSLGGIRVQQCAARCGQNCGHRGRVAPLQMIRNLSIPGPTLQASADPVPSTMPDGEYIPAP